jgi:hypothetical protein
MALMALVKLRHPERIFSGLAKAFPCRRLRMSMTAG